MRINERLKRVASYVDDNSYIIDVGCDHALLDIYLIKTKKNIKTIASDISDGPLEYAYKNIEKENLLNKIKITKRNGIDNLEKEVDTIVISGMGTSNVLDIIFRNKENLKNIKKIIISSNNDWYSLRKIFTENNYYIKEEDIILENDKFYPIVIFEKGTKKYKKYELKYGPILLKSNNEVFKKYIEKEISKLNNIKNSLTNKYLIKKIKLKKEIRFLKKI